MLSLLWQICDIVLIFIAANGIILKNNLTIWSHWLTPTIFKFDLSLLTGDGCSVGVQIMCKTGDNVITNDKTMDV